MLFEGTGKYFLILLFIYFIVYITVKICLFHIFKSAKVAGWKAFIPFYNKIVLTDILDLKKSVAFMTLIPFANLYYFNIIIEKLLQAYELDPKDSIMFLIVPMYKFPELVFKNPTFRLHLYDNTEEFIHNEKSLFEKEEKVEDIKISDENMINNSNNQIKEIPNNETVFSNSNLEPDKRLETIIEAKQEIKEEKNPITTNNFKPKVCPNCGTKLEPTAKVCFFCGTNV